MADLKRNETNSKTVPPGTVTAFETRRVDVRTLRPHPDNDYSIDAGDVEKLAENIRAVGYLVELPLVREVDDSGLQIVSGHRRVRALKLLGREDESWCFQQVRVALNMSDPDALLALHSGNVFRPVSPAERADLLEKAEAVIASQRASRPEWAGKRTLDILASLYDISRGSAHRQLRYARNLTEEVWDLRDRDLISNSTGDELVTHSPAEQRVFCDAVERAQPKTKAQVDAICKDIFTTDQQLVAQLDGMLGEFDGMVLKIRDRMRLLDGTAAPEGRIVFDVRRLERVADHLDDLLELAHTLEESGKIA